MMDRSDVVRLLGVVATVTGLGVATRWVVTPPVPLPGAAPGAPAPAPAVAAEAVPRLSADSLARAIASRDPFRLARAPAAIPFNPDVVASAGAPPPSRPPRPQLALAGIVLGDAPAALVDGLPGVEGTRVLRVGERVGDYVLRAVSADRAVIAGLDTVWTLRVRSQLP